jgi:hypothetical protein
MPTIVEEGNNVPANRSGDGARESIHPRDIERATVQTERDSDAIDFVRGEENRGERGPDNEPAIPHTQDNKRKHEKNRTKPYRTIARPRLK